MTIIASSLILQKLELAVNLGWSVEERQQTQKVIVDMTIHFAEPSVACDSDELTDTNCYDLLTKSIELYVKSREFRLIEHLAKSIYLHVKSSLQNGALLSIRVCKYPSRYMPSVKDGVSFSYGDVKGEVTL